MDKLSLMKSTTLQDILEKSRVGRILSNILSDPRYFWSIAFLAYLSLVLIFEFFHSIGSEPHGDIKLYKRVVDSIISGELPYQDFEFEYPPYAILWFMIPGLFSSIRGFQVAFGIEVLVIDALLKLALIRLALEEKSKRLLLPVIAFAFATAANNHFYLQRFDLIPAAVSFAMLIAFYRKQYYLSGALLAFGFGCKLYPILFAPPLLIIAWKNGGLRQFIVGFLVLIAPLILLGFVTPWWQFMAFHTGRGLQCESIYASILWLGKLFGVFDLNWVFTKAWVEVTGPAATAVLPYAKIIFVATTFISVICACVISYKNQQWTLPNLARLLLIPLCAFVCFNIVLSPQYLIWIIALAAVAALDGRLHNVILITIAAVITPIIYPGFNYGSGLRIVETIVLVSRNIMLIIALLGFIFELRDTKDSSAET